MKEIKVKVNIDSKEANKAVDQLDDSIKDTTSSTKMLTDKLDQMTGGAVSGFRNMLNGTKQAIMGMKSLKVAIAATGIGALVVAVGSLVSYFTNTQRGADKINQVFKAVGATIDVLVDRLSTFGEGLYEIIFNGNFDKGLDILKGSFQGVTEEIINESKAAIQLEKDFQALEKRQIDFIVTERKMEAQIKAARLASEDYSKSVEERNAANEEAIKLERELGDARAEIAREELRIASERIKLGESTNEDYREQANLQARLFEIEGMRDERLKELIAKRRTLNDELTKYNENKRVELEILEPMESNAEASIEQDPILTRQELLNKKLLEANERFQKQKTHLEVLGAKNRRDLDKKIKDEQIAIEMGYYQAVSQLLSASVLMSEGNANAQKGIAAAEATFNTYAAIVAQLKTFSGVPVPGYAIAQAVATGIFGLAQVKKILSTDIKSPSTGSISAPRGSSGSIPTPQSDQAVPNFDSINQGVGGNQNADVQPLRAYVVDQEIRNERKISERIRDQSKL